MLAYAVSMILVLIGSYAVLSKENIIKKLMGLAIFTNGIHLFLISIGYKSGGIAPIFSEINFNYLSSVAVDPLPQALVLTSIVIDLSVTAVALALAVQVYKRFRTLNADKIRGLKG